ncbi:MAG: DUF1559 domain-containing protein [Planctomycetaceae bacterium]|nr:DUF1559 domain-containing protein [Planctomycetaceae bacterium]
MRVRQTMTLKSTRVGFTLVELLVVIAIIAMLVMMLLPAINASRESARRTLCMNKLTQISLAAQSYCMAVGHFPAGVTDPAPGPIISEAKGFHQGWIIQLLPHLEENNLYNAIDKNVSVYAKQNLPARERQLSLLLCPSSPSGFGPIGTSDYAGVHHQVEAPINSNNRGVLFLNSRITRDQITDGGQYTLLIGEKLTPELDVMGWMSGTRATLRNTGTLPNQTQPLAVATESTVQQFVEDSAGGLRDESAVSGVDDAQAIAEKVEANTTEKAPAEIATADVPGDYVEAEVTDDDGTQVVTETETREEIDPNDPWAAAKKSGLYVGGFGSRHHGGAMFAFADGRVLFLADSIDAQVYRDLGCRDDGQLIDAEHLE